MIKHLCTGSFVVTLALGLMGCLGDAPAEPKTEAVESSIAVAAGTCRYVCTRVVGGNEYQLDDTDPNNPPDRCKGNNSCTPPNPLTCASPGLVSNPPCS